MKRDFSESARQELLKLVKQVEDEELCDLTDWVGDRWYDFEGWIGQLDIRKYVDNVNSYHKKVIDKNNASAADINKIFEAVNTQNTNYQGRFLAILTDLQAYCQLLGTISNVISPGNGDFTAEYIGAGLKDAVNSYMENSRLLQEITDDGLTTEELEVEDPDRAQELLERLGSTLVDCVPNVKAGQRYEIPIGPDTTFYYEVEAKVDGNSNVDIEAVIEDQRLKITKIGTETDGMLRVGAEYEVDGNGKITISSDASSVEFDFTNQMLGGSGSIKVGDNTYTIQIKMGANKWQVEESVTTDVEGGSVTTKIGIEKDNNGNGWSPVAEPVPVEVPYPARVPEFDLDYDVDWETVGEVAVVAAVIYGVVYIGAAIYTGGGSMTVMPVPVVP